MHAIRAAHAFDGRTFMPGAATVFIDRDRIVGVERGPCDVPDGVEVADYPGTVLPGLIDCHTHLIADATVGGLERAGTMPDDAVDTVITESLWAHAAAGELAAPREVLVRGTPVAGRLAGAVHGPGWSC
jgi:imidazolonepropionase-like amidohydrolase